MDKPVKIYCLKDPITNEIKYIGKTWTILKERLRLHIATTKKSKKLTRKEKWIKGLLFKKLKPLIKTLETVSIQDWRRKEISWIEKGKRKKWPLLNLKKGGDGYDNLTHTKKWKDDLRKRMKGNKYGKGIKWTEEQKQLRRLTPPWNKGKILPKHSKKTKLKMSRSQKKRWKKLKQK